MIGFLQGKVLLTDNSSLLLDVNGVGYRVFAPLPVLVSVTKKASLSLFIHTHVREDHIILYGFKDENELFLFEKLTSVSGIGPKSALAMLSVHSPSSLSDAIERSDAEALSHTPGVGKKTAEKIILELKGKLSHLIGKEMNDTTLEVRLALEALGYSSKEIHEALKDMNTEGKTTSTIIKEALHQLQ
jgi:Holliday junction DNA helicase RuvA